MSKLTDDQRQQKNLERKKKDLSINTKDCI